MMLLFSFLRVGIIWECGGELEIIIFFFSTVQLKRH